MDIEMTAVKAEYAEAGKYAELLGGFGFYAEGQSVAIVWSGDDFAQKAIDYFVEKYVVASTLKIDDGSFEFVSYDATK